MNIHFKTFGCKVNQCETVEMQRDVLKAGCFLSEPEDANVIVINSCTVTGNADSKARQCLRKYQRLNPKAKVFLTGCYVDRADSELKKDFPDVKLFKNSQKQNVLELLGFSATPYTLHPAPCFSTRTRAFVKIQDGCDGKCTYCIVPKVRPKLSSRNIEEVTEEVKGYVSSGHKEIVLCGIRLGKYGGRGRVGSPAAKKREEGRGKRDWALVDLIMELEKIEGLCRIRLSSIELNDISGELLGLMAESKKLCHHLHIPLQSGDDGILKAMGRPYTSTKFFEKIKKIKKNIPDIGITTDIIIGYPLDTGKSLSNTYNFAEKCRFSRMHVFKYSKRPGTIAGMLNRKCPDMLINKCGDKMRALDLLLRRKFMERFSGRKMDVLAEENGCGYTSNYIHVKLPQSVPANEIFSVNI